MRKYFGLAAVFGIIAGVAFTFQNFAKVDTGSSPFESIDVSRELASVGAASALTADNITPNGFNVSWPPIPGASSYKLKVAMNDTFTTVLQNYNDLEVQGTSHVVKGLTANMVYYVRVKASTFGDDSDELAVLTGTAVIAGECGAGTGLAVAIPPQPWSCPLGGNCLCANGSRQPLQFNTEKNEYSWVCTGFNGGANASCTAPAKNLKEAQVTSNSITLNWKRVFGADSYVIELSTTDNFSEPTKTIDVNGREYLNGEFNVQIDDLKANSDYYLRVRTLRNNRLGPLTSAVRVRTLR